MKWKDAIDLVGLVAILAGLMFVYRELELNATISRAELSAETNRSLYELEGMLIDGTLTETYLRSLREPGNMTQVERMQMNVFLTNVIQQYRRECYYHNLGIFVECESIPRETALRFFSSEYGRAFWATVREHMVGPRIRDIVDEELARVPSSDLELQLDAAVLQKLRQ